MGQEVTYVIESGAGGKAQARQVHVHGVTAKANWAQPGGTTSAASRLKGRHAERGPRRSVWSLLPVVLFVLLYVVVAIAWRVPDWAGVYYLAASSVAWLAYVADKSAARRGEWRVSESALLWLGFLGGWPGAIVAQQIHRHKSSKASFRAVFWTTVVLNVGVFLSLASPMARPYWIAAISETGRALGLR